MARISKKLEATAYHEAGHAVMAILVRMGFGKVTIERKRDSLGHILHNKWRKTFSPRSEDMRSRYQLEKAIRTCLAGPVAEKMWSGEKHIKWGADGSHAVEYASYLSQGGLHHNMFYFSGSDRAIEAYLRFVAICCEEQLAITLNWAAVEAVAKALLEKRTINSKECRAVIRESAGQLIKG